MDSSAEFEAAKDLSSSGGFRRCRLMIPASKKAQFYATYRRQAFAFPNSIMNYIAMNPSSPTVCQKLAKTCKYFHHKNPIIVLRELYCNDVGQWYTIWSRSGLMYGLNLSNVGCKFWLTSTFKTYAKLLDDQTLVSSIVPKIYKCDARCLFFKNQAITYHEFTSLATNVEELNLNNAAVKYDDGSDVPLEKLVAAVPKLNELYYFAEPANTTISSKTFAELLKLPHFMALDDCSLIDCPELLDLDNLYTYIKQNKHTKFIIAFVDPLSDGYKRRLDTITDEVLASEYDDYKLPVIYYPGLDEEKREKFVEIYDDF